LATGILGQWPTNEWMILMKKPMDITKKQKKSGEKSWLSYRPIIQIGFVILTLWIGIEYYIFVDRLEQGITPLISRPPGVESFLPISALISFKYWVLTGIFNTIHPAALVLLLIFVGISLFLKKGFCSWICPFGWFSEMLAKLHIMIFDRQFKLPKWLDYSLRSLKYLLLLFFVWAVFVEMNQETLKNFIYSPYNRVADIKMLHFFTYMSDVTFWTLAILVGLSLAVPFFWCRYLCPYGAMVGAISWLSPFKINRSSSSCIDCEKCTDICPAKILVHKGKTVFSDECHACLQCVDVCPVEDTLYLSATNRRFKISKKTYAWAIVIIFIAGTSIARLLGVWDNSISEAEYHYHMKHLNGPEYNHNRGEVSEYDQDRWQPAGDK
jgi:polyferredoxin